MLCDIKSDRFRRYNFILQHGADPNKKNRDGHTPLDLVKEGDTDVQDLLRGKTSKVLRVIGGSILIAVVL